MAKHTATGGTSVGDTIRPQVISISPSAETHGEDASSNITVTFSEPMNTTSVTQSLGVSGLVTGDLTFAWNAQNTTLTITPKAGFACVQGSDPTTTSARAYVTTITSGAKDVARNGLATDFTSTFYTLRRLSHALAPQLVAGFITYMLTVTECASAASTFSVGYLSTTVAGERSGIAIFDPQPLGIQTLESAVIVANQKAPVGNFYAAGRVNIELDAYGSPVTSPQVSDFTVLAALGTFATAPRLRPSPSTSPPLPPHGRLKSSTIVSWESTGPTIRTPYLVATYR